MKKNAIIRPMLLAFGAALLISGCGGGDSAPSSTQTTTTQQSTQTTTTEIQSTTTATQTTTTQAAGATISGSVVKGPVSNATVTIKKASDGAVLATVVTDSSGAYKADVPFQGEVIIEVSGGTYVDEATNLPTPLSSPMKVVVNATGKNVIGMVTPLTTMAYSLAFGTTTNSISASSFNTAASKVASQFKLNNTNLATLLPTIGNNANDYGKVLHAIAQYLNDQKVTLQTFTNANYTAAQWTQFSERFTAAYKSAHPNSPITFDFDGSVFSVGGTGAGGGSGTCGINVQGTMSVGGFTAPLNLDYCISGIAAGSCAADNLSLSQALAGQGGVQGAANLNYTYTPTCKSGALTINLK